MIMIARANNKLLHRIITALQHDELAAVNTGRNADL
jgi:hypothetical protein